MRFFRFGHKRQVGAEGAPQAGFIVALYRKSRTLRRTLETECGHNGVTARRQARIKRTPVSGTIRFVNKKMEDGPVVPEIPRFLGPERRDVCHNPIDTICRGPETLLTLLQGLMCDVQHGKVAVTVGQEGIDERGRTTADVNNSRISRQL